MEVNGQLHASAVLPPVKEIQIRIIQGARRNAEPALTRWGGERKPTPAGNRTPIVQPVN